MEPDPQGKTYSSEVYVNGLSTWQAINLTLA